MRATASEDNESGGNAWSTTLLVRLAMQQLPEEQQETLWNVACSETIGQAAELDGVTLPAMIERKVRAIAAFLASFNLPMAEAIGVVREPASSYPHRRRWPAWYHERKRCPVCRVPVETRYLGDLHCEQCGRPMMPSRTGQDKRYCSQACRKRASRQGVTNSKSVLPTFT